MQTEPETEGAEVTDTTSAAAMIENGFVELAITTGQKQFAGVGDGRKFQITPLGIRFVGKPSYEQWMDVGRFLKNAGHAWDFWYADFIAGGRTLFGDEKVTEALTQLEFDMLDTARAYAIGQTLLDFRSPQLTSEHYYVLGSAIPGDDKGRERWARIAEKENLTALELKKSIEAGKIIRQDNVNAESGRGAGIANMQGLKFWFERWEKQAGGHDAILQWPVERKRQWLDEMKPLTELARELEATL